MAWLMIPATNPNPKPFHPARLPPNDQSAASSGTNETQTRKPSSKGGNRAALTAPVTRAAASRSRSEDFAIGNGVWEKDSGSPMNQSWAGRVRRREISDFRQRDHP